MDIHALNDRPRLAKVTHDCLIKEVGSDDDADANENNNNIMSEEDILEFLNGSEGRKEIDQALYALNEMGVHGIPKFIIEGKRVVAGAAHSNTFIDIFREIEEKGAVHAGAVFGELNLGRCVRNYREGKPLEFEFERINATLVLCFC